ncbi:unnamed protein product [Peniophora sp. CBMAI 1063]|nr:unnamed protein product [Peniophora sp. CBMAI 1063]
MSSTPIIVHMCMRSDDMAPAPGTFLRWVDAPLVKGVAHLCDMVDKTKTFKAEILFSEAIPTHGIPLRCKARKENMKDFTLETVQALPNGPNHWLCSLSCSVERFEAVMLILAFYEARHACPYTKEHTVQVKREVPEPSPGRAAKRQRTSHRSL